jgi:hypothetical protein
LFAVEERAVRLQNSVAERSFSLLHLIEML